MGAIQQGNLRYLVMVSFLWTSAPPTVGVHIRLAGSGSTQCSGRVEIYHNNAWGTVCDDNWDLNDAKVVCRELGCGTALSAPQSAIFGEGSGQIWLDEVGCSGSEKSLTECKHREFGAHDCNHNEDASVVCSVSLPKPSISMNPAGVVTWGQDVSITCSISSELLGGTFILTSGSFRKIQTSNSNSASFSIHKVNFDNEGLYQCQHEKRISSQSFTSPLSDSVRLSVTVSFPKPSISLNPAGEVAWGQDVSITCSISTQVLGGTFILTSDSSRETQTSNTSSVTFHIPQVDFDHEELYWCLYEKNSSSQSFSSPQSDSVRLSITVALQQPTISLTSPNGGLVWRPEGAEVTRGYSFIFICSISSQYPEGRFFLIFSGSDITNTKPAVNHSASFTFHAAEYEHQGNYSCVYEVTLSTRKFNSTETAPITVVIELPLLLLASSVASGILLLFLLVLMVFCLVLRRRQRAKQPGALIQTQLVIRVRNEYENEEDKNEDEEGDYVNIDLVDNKRRFKEETVTVEYDDYEEPESDGDHDYEEATTDTNIKANKICFSVEENKEEEEEEETSEDEDYENVTQSLGEHEDIYQNF